MNSFWGFFAGCGAALGAMAVTFIRPSLSFRFRGIMILGLFLLMMVFSIARDHVPSLWYSLITVNLMGGMLVAIIVVGALQGVADGWEWLRPLEPVGFGLFLCIPFLSSDGGDFTKPQWLSDLVVQRGSTVETSLFVLGISIAIFSVMTLFRAPKENIRSVKALLGIICVVFLVLVVGYALFQFLPSVPATHRPPLLPPMSFSGNPPPPPPPQPQPVAIVQFSKPLVGMSYRLNGFYFRTTSAEEEGQTNLDTNSPQVLQAQVYFTDNNAYPLAIIGQSIETNLPSPNPQRFKKAEFVYALLPQISKGSDFTQGSADSLGTINLATDEPAVTGSPEISSVIRKVEDIISGKEQPVQGSLLESVAAASSPDSPPSPSLMAGTLVDWIEWNGAFDSEVKSAPPVDLDAFLKSGMRGNSRQFTELAVALLKAKGIKARIAEGYILPAEKVPTDRLVINDAEKDCWPEVLTQNGVWIPMPVHPRKVISHQNPPPQEDTKNELFDALKARQKQSAPPAEKKKTGSFSLNPNDIFLIILTVFVLVFAGICVLYQWFQRTWSEPILRITEAKPSAKMNHFALNEASRIAERMYRKRNFGESWKEYAEDLSTKYPSSGIAFNEMLRAFEGHSDSPKFWTPLYKKVLFSFLVSKFGFFRLQHRNQNANPIS